MGLSLKKSGDWERAGIVLQGLCKNIRPVFIAQLQEDGDFVQKKIVGHIDAQDLSWAPLSEHTITLKGGSTTIYVETGLLRDNITVKKVTQSSNGVTFFIGPDDVQTADGEKLTNVMIWLEYGTDKMPARPLIRPTWEEVLPILKEHWTSLLSDLAKGSAK